MRVKKVFLLITKKVIRNPNIKILIENPRLPKNIFKTLFTKMLFTDHFFTHNFLQFQGISITTFLSVRISNEWQPACYNMQLAPPTYLKDPSS